MPTASKKKTPPAKNSKQAVPAKKKPAPPVVKKTAPSKPAIKGAPAPSKPAAPKPAPPVKGAAAPVKPASTTKTVAPAKATAPSKAAALPAKAAALPAKAAELPAKVGTAVAKAATAVVAKVAPGKAEPPKPLATKSGLPAPKPGTPEAKADARAAAAAAAAAAGTAPPKPPKPPKKSARRMIQRRGPDGELLAPGELLLPAGVQHIDESLYLLRGAAAAEHPAPEEAIAEVQSKRKPEANIADEEIARQREMAFQRFESSQIESLLPVRPPGRRTFQGVVERAKHRRREIGAFLRGLDLGRTETSHMDSHGEASLQSLMEWAARLEVLAEADEPEKADYAQFLRVLDQLDNTTESLVVDVELTLRRLRDRLRATGRT